MAALRLLTNESWNESIKTLPYAHILQTEEWGEFKRRSTGWMPEKILLRDQHDAIVGGALVLTRRLGPLAVMYIPKGPMIEYADPLLLNQMLDRLEGLARKVFSREKSGLFPSNP